MLLLVMITIKQIKAARALLDWKQSDLARISGMALATIANLEQGRGTPRPETLDVVQATFETFGVEFIRDHGVDLRPEKFDVQILHGDKAHLAIIDDYEKTLAKSGGGEVLVSNLDHQYMFDLYQDELEAFCARRPSLNINLRGLVKKNDQIKIWPNEEFRALPSRLFQGMTPVCMYGDKTAMVNFNNPVRVILIDNKSITDAMKQQFEYMWELGQPIRQPIYMS